MSNGKEKLARVIVTALCTVAMPTAALAAPIMVGFDDLGDSVSVTGQYAGLQFSQATVLKAGLSLNESAFPPRSLDGVVFDDGGPISIDFSGPVFSVGGYFTYLNGLTLSAYDIDGNLLGTVASAFTINLADGSGDFGSSPNEFLQFSSVGGLISRVTFSSDLGGGSFVLDDLVVDAGTAIPEPSTIVLMAGALGAALARRRRPRRS